MSADPLGALVAAAADGYFPPDDGGVTVVAPARPDLATVLEFTGHAVVAADVGSAAVVAQGADGFGGAISPHFLLWLAGGRGRVGSHDAVLVARGRGGSRLPARPDLDEHPRVGHARSLRAAVEVYGDERGLVTVGRGLGGITEVSVEVAAGRRGAGIGRLLIADALSVVAEGELVVAEVAPGNARSLRAFLAAGFGPVGSAVHISTGSSP